MIAYALILTFSSSVGQTVQSEEYVIDYKLSKQDCIERMHEEYQDSEDESYDNHEVISQMYKDAVERYKAVKMEGKIVEASFKCVVDSY